MKQDSTLHFDLFDILKKDKIVQDNKSIKTKTEGYKS